MQWKPRYGLGILSQYLVIMWGGNLNLKKEVQKYHLKEFMFIQKKKERKKLWQTEIKKYQTGALAQLANAYS